jgi:hypothetical protein
MNSQANLEQAKQVLGPILRKDIEVSFVAESRFWWCVARSTSKGWPLGVGQGSSPEEAAERLIRRYQLRQLPQNRGKVLLASD